MKKSWGLDVYGAAERFIGAALTGDDSLFTRADAFLTRADSSMTRDRLRPS